MLNSAAIMNMKSPPDKSIVEVCCLFYQKAFFNRENTIETSSKNKTKQNKGKSNKNASDSIAPG